MWSGVGSTGRSGGAGVTPGSCHDPGVDVAITGSTGLVGRALSDALTAGGHRVVPMVRPATGRDGLAWDPESGAVDTSGLSGVGAVVHLAGEGIGGRRWNAAHKARVMESRRQGTRVLAEALARLDLRPAVFLSASAVGWYGDRADEVLTEESAAGAGFVAEVCREWEGATAPAEEAGIRVVHLRSGLVLSRGGGLLPRMLLPFRLGVGGRLGSGHQWMSWISIADEVAAILHLLGADDVRGPVNLTGPEPVTNRVFTKTLGRVLRRPTVLPLPAVALKAAFGREMAGETVLISQRVLPQRLTDSGFTFAHPSLDVALRAVLDR